MIFELLKGGSRAYSLIVCHIVVCEFADSITSLMVCCCCGQHLTKKWNAVKVRFHERSVIQHRGGEEEGTVEGFHSLA